MLSNDDIKRITDAQIEAQKEIFYTKDDLDTKFSSLKNSIDAFALDKKNKDEGLPVINKRIKDTEDWIKKAAIKVGVEFNP